MMLSIFYVAVFAALLSGIVCFPKKKGTLNGVKGIVAGVMTVLCLQALIAGALDLVHIRVGLLSIGTVFLALAAALWACIRKRGRQRLFWRWSDIACVLLFFCCVCMAHVHCYGTDFLLQGQNGDEARFFAEAMEILRTGSVTGAYFAQLTAAVGMKLFWPIWSSASCYKAYLLTKLFLQTLELGMLYVALLTVSEKKIVRVGAPLLCIAYFWGYPAYNYLEGGFLSWGSGVMIFLLIVYVLLLWEKGSIPAWQGATGAAAAALVWVSCESPAFWRLESAVGKQVYSCMYGDLIFFVPVLLYVLWQTIARKKTPKLPGALAVFLMTVTIGVYIAWYQERVDINGYFKLYYYLWAVGWILTAQALELAFDDGELPEAFAYAGMLGVLLLLELSGAGDILVQRQSMDSMYDFYETENLLALYRYNAEQMRTDHTDGRLSEETLQIYQSVAERGTKSEILTGDANRGRWFEALTGGSFTDSSFEGEALPDLLRRMQDDGDGQLVVWKDDPAYEKYERYLEECPVIQSEEEIIVCGAKGGDWLDVSWSKEAQDENRQELFGYVREHLNEETVPLLAAEESYMDFILYEAVSGNASTDFYTERFTYSPAGSIVNLNARGVRYVVLLKDDPYFETGHAYFDRNGEVVYENEAGKIVQCQGDEWSLMF